MRRHYPLPTALAFGHEHPPLTGIDVVETQAQYLAASQTTQQHRLDHGPVTVGAHAAGSASTSLGASTRGSVRGVRINGTPPFPRRAPGRRAARLVGTGLRLTPVSPRAAR